MFIKLSDKNELVDISPVQLDGYIDFPEIYENRRLVDNNGKYLYKVVDSTVMETLITDRYSVSEYAKTLDDKANQLTYDTLKQTDYVEIRECDPDEPNKLSKADLKLFREYRRAFRANYRQLSVDLLAATSIEACDLIYKTWEANKHAINEL